MAEGKVVSLQVCVGHRMPMDFKDRVNVMTGQGLEGDRHALPRSRRQVLLMEQEILDALELAPGDIRENVTVSGIELHGLAEGRQVRIGAEVTLEVTGVCEPCERMDELRLGLRETIRGRRGVLTRVVQGGAVSIGDPVRVAEDAPAA